jgi:hypothetical protein
MRIYSPTFLALPFKNGFILSFVSGASAVITARRLSIISACSCAASVMRRLINNYDN